MWWYVTCLESPKWWHTPLLARLLTLKPLSLCQGSILHCEVFGSPPTATTSSPQYQTHIDQHVGWLWLYSWDVYHLQMEMPCEYLETNWTDHIGHSECLSRSVNSTLWCLHDVHDVAIRHLVVVPACVHTAQSMGEGGHGHRLYALSVFSISLRFCRQMMFTIMYIFNYIKAAVSHIKSCNSHNSHNVHILLRWSPSDSYLDDCHTNTQTLPAM